MAVVTSDAVQMPPPVAASPGLPPVDPVTRPAAHDGMRNARPPSGARTVVRTGEAHSREVSVPTDRRELFVRMTPLPGSAVLGQENEPAKPEQIVAGQEGAGSLGDPLTVVPRTEPEKSIPPIDVAAKADRSIVVPDPDQPVLSDVRTKAYEHSIEPVTKDGSIDSCYSGAGTVSGAAPMARVQAGPQSLDIDSIGLPEFSVADEPARRSTRMPPRIVGRPRVEEWTDDELLTLPEAAALFWPAGPITTNTLRTAGRDGSLVITKVAGKFFTTPMAIRRMGLDEVGEKPKQQKPDETSATSTLQMKIAEAQRLGGGRARSRRAARGSVATAGTGVPGQ